MAFLQVSTLRPSTVRHRPAASHKHAEHPFAGPDPLWNEVLDQHQAEPYHCVIGGGDQIYCDPLTKEKEISEWVNMKSVKDKTKAPLTEPMKFAIDRFLFNHYCTWFRSGAFGKTISQIPMLNILDDHDLIVRPKVLHYAGSGADRFAHQDGFGSYPDSLQTSPVRAPLAVNHPSAVS